MAFILKFQFADKNPDELETIGEVTYDEAVKRFYDFDWKKQKKICEERELVNLTSSLPAYMLFNESESLTINEDTDDNYFILYQKGNKFEEDFISNDLTKNPNVNSIEGILSSFFDGNLYANEEIHNDTDIEADEIINPEDNIGKYSLKKYNAIFWWLTVPIVSLFIFMGATGIDINKNSFFLTLGFSYLTILLLHIPFLIILFQYLSKPRVITLNYSDQTKSLTLILEDRQVTVSKDEISQLVFTEAKNPGTYYTQLGALKNMVISLKNGQQYFLTSLTFSEYEFYSILELLKVHYYHLEKIFPVIITKQFNNIKNFASTNFADKVKLQEKYSEYTEQQLKNITENPKDYQPVAVEVAKHLLKFRKFNKNN